jgi:hypothetical protein
MILPEQSVITGFFAGFLGRYLQNERSEMSKRKIMRTE